MRNASQRGQAMLLSLVLLSLSSILLLLLFQVGTLVKEKIRLQTAADLALLSALHAQANFLNALAVCNRTVLAQDALAGRLNALVSEAAFIRKVLDAVSWLVRLIPYAGPLLGQAVQRGGQALERAFRQVARVGIPVVGSANSLMAAQSRVIRSSLVPLPLAAARDSLRVNAPSARMSPVSQAALLGQGRALDAGISPLSSREAKGLVEKTLDPHSRRRDWRILAGSMPVRKTGGTSAEDDDFRAFDRLEFKVLKKGKWRWKTLFSTRSLASDFRYRGHGALLGLDEEAVPRGLTLLLTQKAESRVGWVAPPGLPLSAVSSGRLLYRREGRPGERPNLFNPFWTARLIPVATEKGARDLVPPALLKEILH